MRGDLEYKLFVEPPVFSVMEQVVKDAQHFDLTRDEVVRAVYNWFIQEIAETAPEWLMKEVGKQ